MRTLLVGILLTVSTMAHAQRGSSDRTSGWTASEGEIELAIRYEQDVIRSRTAPASITLRTSARSVVRLSEIAVELNGRRGPGVRLTPGERRGVFVGRAEVPSPEALTSVGLLLGETRVLFPIPALEEDEDGNRAGTYSDDDGGFWLVIKVGTKNPPPFIVIIIGDPPDEEEPEDTEETETDDKEENSQGRRGRM